MIKKILFFMLLILFNSPIYAKEIKVDYLKNITANRYSKEQTYSGKLGFILDGDRVIYCIEPFKWIGDNYDINNNYFNSFDNYTNDYIRLVANYTDQLVQKRDVRYYMAAQSLIWESITDGAFTFTTNDGIFGTTIFVDEEKKEIDNYAKTFLKKPDFGSIDIKGNMYEIIELTDNNNVLQTFNIINESKNEVWSDGNKLFIKILSSDSGQIKFDKSIGEGDAIYYHNEQRQDLADLKSKVSNSFSITVSSNEPYYSDYRIEFIDEETNELITTNIDFKINGDIHSCTNGIYIDRFSEGVYDVDIITIPQNYIIPDKSSFKIESNDSNNYTYKIYLKKKKNVKSSLDDADNYCILDNFNELPNTIDYIKVMKIGLIILIIIEIIRHVKKIFKD